MKTNNNTILITGGATGIGLALADIFIQGGNNVIICGRRQEKLLEAQFRFPEIHTKVCDVSDLSNARRFSHGLRENFQVLIFWSIMPLSRSKLILPKGWTSNWLAKTRLLLISALRLNYPPCSSRT